MALTENPLDTFRRDLPPRPQLVQYYEQGADNTQLVAALAVSGRERVLEVGVKYDATATQAGVTVERDSDVGAAYDTILHTGAADAEDTVWLPAGDVWLGPDGLRVTAPAGGAGVAATVYIITERY